MSVVTISSFQPLIAWPFGGSTATLRYTYSGDFVDSTNTPALRGLYKDIPCTISAGVLSIPSHTILSTLDALVNPLVTLTAQFIDYRGAKRSWLFQNLPVPTTTPTTIGALEIYGQGGSLVLPPDWYLTAIQVQNLINIAQGTLNDASDVVKGRTFLDVAPASASHPEAIGSNSPRAGAPYNVKSYGALGDGATNDTAAFSAALTAIGSTVAYLFLPPGQYVLSNLTIPLNVTLQTIGGSIKMVTGQTLTVNRILCHPGNQMFFNATSGQGTIKTGLVSGTSPGAACPFVTPFMWGAKGRGVSGEDYAALQACSDFALGGPGAEHGDSNAANIPINLMAGYFDVGNNKWVIRNAYGIHIYGNGRYAATVQGNGDAVDGTVFQTDGLWYSTIERVRFAKLTASAGPTVDIDGNVPGHAYPTRSVQGNTFSHVTFQGTGNDVNFYLVRQGGGSAQGSENVWENCHWISATTQFKAIGSNALNNTFISGDMQDHVTGIFSQGFAFTYIDPAMESGKPYEQATQGGFDFHTGEFGSGEKIVIIGGRSESLQVWKGSNSQQGSIVGFDQNFGSGFTLWSALGNYTLHQVLVKNVVVAGATRTHAYYVSTAGVSGAVEPTWPATGTVADGSIVWTEMPFLSVDTTTIGGPAPNIDIQNCSFAGPCSIGGWVASTVNAGTLTAAYTNQLADWQHPRVFLDHDTSGGAFAHTLNRAPLGQVLICAHTVGAAVCTLTGGTATIGGKASIVLPLGSSVMLIQTATNVWVVESQSNGFEAGVALTVSSNTIAPVASVHDVGAGLIKTITVPAGFPTGWGSNTIALCPTAAFTYDATGNILGTGTAVIGRTMFATYSTSTSKWSLSY